RCSWSLGGVAHDAVGSQLPARATRIVQVVQMGYGLAHGEERLVRVELAPEKQPEELRRAPRAALEGLVELLEVRFVVRFELRHALVRPAEGLAVRGQHEDVGRQAAVAADGLEAQ